MLRVGLTGGIGSGKSLVAGRFDELGATVIDADRIAREVVEPGTPGLAAVVTEFGEDVLTSDGTLDRPRLGKIVFADEGRRKALNAIVHPLVYQRRQELVEQAGSDAIVVEDVPLLVENNLAAAYQLVIVVHAPERERIRRLAADRGMSESDALARIRAQATDDERRAAADVWIDNSGDPAQTLAMVDEVWHHRLVPFEANLRTGRRAPRNRQPAVVEPDPTWPTQAQRLIDRLAAAVGDRALRIDHVGSTSVPGLPARDLIDIQIVTSDLATAGEVANDVRRAGFVPVPGRWFDTDRHGRRHEKRIAVDADPGRPVDVLIQPSASPVWRDILLFRDWLRADPEARAEYTALKRRLEADSTDVDDYRERKVPWINAALGRADTWAVRQGWQP